MELAGLIAELSSRGEVRLRVKVAPKSSRNEIAGVMADGTLKIRVQAPPDKGKANAAVCELLAEAFGVGPRDVTIVSGLGSPLKHVRVSRQFR